MKKLLDDHDKKQQHVDQLILWIENILPSYFYLKPIFKTVFISLSVHP